MSSKRGSMIVVFQESVTKTSWRDSLHSRESAISHGSRRPQTETASAHQWEKTVKSSTQRGMKPQKEKRRRIKSEQHPYHPHPKPSAVQSVVWCAHQESVSTATNERARIDHQPSQQSSSARNEPPHWPLSFLNVFLKLILVVYSSPRAVCVHCHCCWWTSCLFACLWQWTSLCPYKWFTIFHF